MGSENIQLGICQIKYDGVDMGLTSGGTELTYAPEYTDITVDQFGKTPVQSYLAGERVEVKAVLAEATLANLKSICPVATLVTDGAKQKVTFGSAPGKQLLSLAKTLVLHPISRGADTSMDVTIYKAVIKSEFKLGYKIDSATLLDVTFAALVDQTKTDGDYLFCIGNSSANLDMDPATVAVVPANAAVNVDKAVTTTIQMTFTKDMDPATITGEHIHVFADVAGTEVAGVLSYDKANKRAIFTPNGAWTGSTAYRVYIGIGVRTINGVAMASPTITKFTTAA